MPEPLNGRSESFRSLTKWWMRGLAVGIIASGAAELVYYWPPRNLVLRLTTNSHWELMLRWILLAIFLATVFALINWWMQKLRFRNAK